MSWRARRSGVCPSCERPLASDTGAELRPIDLRYEEVEAAQRERFRQLLPIGSAVAAAISLVVPLFHLGSAVAVPLLILAHLLTVRLLLIRDARRLLGAKRRMFNRWMARLSFLWFGCIGYGLTVIPVAGAIAGAGTFAGLTTVIHRYTLWSLDRERQRLPLAAWEKLVLAMLVLLTVIALVVALLLALVVGFSVAKLVEMVGAE